MSDDEEVVCKACKSNVDNSCFVSELVEKGKSMDTLRIFYVCQNCKQEGIILRPLRK